MEHTSRAPRVYLLVSQPVGLGNQLLDFGSHQFRLSVFDSTKLWAVKQKADVTLKKPADNKVDVLVTDGKFVGNEQMLQKKFPDIKVVHCTVPVVDVDSLRALLVPATATA